MVKNSGPAEMRSDRQRGCKNERPPETPPAGALTNQLITHNSPCIHNDAWACDTMNYSERMSSILLTSLHCPRRPHLCQRPRNASFTSRAIELPGET